MSDSGPESKGKYQKLLDMGFMKKAAAQQREMARVEAQGVLRELRAMEEEGVYDSEEDNSESPEELARRRNLMKEAAANIDTLLPGKKGIRFLAPGSGSKGLVRMSGNVSVGAGSSQEIDSNGGESNPWLTRVEGESSARHKRSESAVLHADIDSALDANSQAPTSETSPLQGSTTNSSGLKRSSVSSLPLTSNKVNKSVSVSVRSAAAPSTEASSSQDAVKKALDDKEAKKRKVNERKPLLMQKSQEDLVKMAFAGPSYEDEFEASKKKAVDEEIEVDEKRNKILATGTRSANTNYR